jgi:hypothetical protein
VTALFRAVDGLLLRQGFMARCGQMIDATLVPAPIQHFTKEEKEQLAQGMERGQARQVLEHMPEKAQHRIVKTRARVEHPFAQMRHMGGKFVRPIGLARATVAMTMIAACYNIKRLAMFVENGVDTFYKDRSSKTEVRLQGANA